MEQPEEFVSLGEGAGKYDELATELRARFKAKGIMIVIIGGTEGSGLQIQMGFDDLVRMPSMLLDLSLKISEDLLKYLARDDQKNEGQPT